MNLRVFISESEVFSSPQPASLILPWANNVVGLGLASRLWDLSGDTELGCGEVLAAESDIGGNWLQKQDLWLEGTQVRCGYRPQNEGKGGTQTHLVERTPIVQ